MLNIQLKKCRDRPDCKTDDQIKQYLQDKYIILLHNSIRFDSALYGEESIVPESHMLWYNINTQQRQTLPLKVLTTDVEL